MRSKRLMGRKLVMLALMRPPIIGVCMSFESEAKAAYAAKLKLIKENPSRCKMPTERQQYEMRRYEMKKAEKHRQLLLENPYHYEGRTAREIVEEDY
jgi:hypothetical protein